MTERLMGKRELADMLDVPIRTLEDWLYRRTAPPSFRVGRHVRFRPSEVEAWLECQRERGADLGGRSTPRATNAPTIAKSKERHESTA